MSELKRCPFCGGEALLNVIEPHKHEFATFMPDYGGGSFIECTKCTCAMSGETSDEVVKAWNTRKPMQRIVERLEQQAKQYRRRCNELVEKGYIQMGDRQLGKACSYEHAIEIVKEEGGA